MRFSVQTLFAMVTAIAVALYLLVAAPTVVAVPLLVSIHTAIAALLVVGIIHGTARPRAFCMGALIPAGATIVGLTWMLCAWFIASPWNSRNWTELAVHLDRFVFTLRVWSASTWILELVVGMLCAWTLRHLPTRRSDAPRNDEG